MFREAVLTFLGPKEKKDYSREYCIACKKAKRNHCETCDRKIDIIYS